MSLLSLFDLGKTAIYASQTALNVTAHNIANVNTPEYSRQEVILEITPPVETSEGYLGRGVTVNSIRRHYNKFLQGQLLSQRQSYGRSLALNEGLGHAEQIFNEAQGIGLSNLLNGFFNAWQDVANNPSGQAERTVLLEKADAIVQTAKRMESGLEDILSSTDEEMANIVDRVNALATEIADVNVKILETEAGGLNNANDMRDTREGLLGELGELIEFNYFEAPDGMVTVIVGNKNIVDKDTATPLEGIMDSSGDLKLYIDGADVGPSIRKGRMGGLLALKDEVRSELLTPLRKLMASVVYTVNEEHKKGFDLDGLAGTDFFGPDITDPETQYEDVIKNLYVAVSGQRQIAASLGTDPVTGEPLPGDNGNALKIAELAQMGVDISGVSATLGDHYKSIVTAVGSMSSAVGESMAFEETLLSDIQYRRDSVSSVSLDEEAANMIRFQRAFQAGAKMITVTDELLETVLGML
jgi:flagellar hook-associated protein 1 FlgK